MSKQSKTANNPIKKWAKELNRHFPKDMDGQVYKKMLNNGIHQRNTNQKSHRVSPHICLNGIKKTGHSTCWCACGAKGTLLHCRGMSKYESSMCRANTPVKNKSSLYSPL